MDWIKVTPETMPPDKEPVFVSAFYKPSGREEVYGRVRWNEKSGKWQKGIYDSGEIRWEWWKGSEITKWMPSTSEELKICPFCGGQAEIFMAYRDSICAYTGEVVEMNVGMVIDLNMGDPYYRIKCKSCGCKHNFSSKVIQEVINDWNNRI